MYRISEESCDKLVELLFLALPETDGDELAKVLHVVIAIVEREIRRAKREERRQWVSQVNTDNRN